METYGYTRLNTFQKCPKKHDYIYNQGLKSKSNKFIKCGYLFHQCLEGFYKGEFETIDQALTDYSDYIKTHDTGLPADLLEYVFTRYTRYYADSDKDEKIICVETEYTDDLGNDEQFLARVDRVVYNQKTGMYILRDTKTTLNKLKYKYDDVNYNQQLLTYIPFVEDEQGIKIDQIEIDEVRLDKLEEVPLNKNGKPTADKKRLDLVTYEDYMNVLESMGLDTEPAYQKAIEYLADRGHPLFNRVSAQILDPMTVQTNMADMYDTFKAIKSGATYRIPGPLCNYCEYHDLCKLDRYSTDTNIREVEIQKIIDLDEIQE